MDSRMISLTVETKSVHLDTAVFQSRVTTLEQRVIAVETQATLTEDRDQELIYLCKEIEGADVQSFLKDILPQLTGLTFDPPLEFQRANRLGPKHRESANHPRPIIACFLRHTQARQLLQKALAQGPFRMNDHQIRMTADFSKETSDRRKAFLALRPVCNN
ncbi:hypothetical protein NDU88_000918 [Pleurodeles waltl]|uniref:Uncharacterized protein n=1 Tax=Pleurodeles waltl TaxID=8319 RepID=A0AAV7V866_PLEWA|nr:hypothetical protein NDU88_000918 [Pleurodeles waltl]